MDEPAEYQAERLRQRLATDERTTALGLDVEVRGDDVFIAGSVETEARRQAVVAVAGEELPGLVIHDGLTVLDLTGHQGEVVG